MGKTKTPSTSAKLFGQYDIPVLLVIGESNTGKSSFLANIMPQQPSDAPKRVLVVDTEGSWATLKDRYHVEYVDLRVVSLNEKGQVDPYKMFVNLIDGLGRIEQGQYDVVIIDVISDIASYDQTYKYIHTKQWSAPQNKHGDYQMASPYIRDFWKTTIGTLSAKGVKCVGIGAHLKNVYRGKQATGDKAQRGIDLMELATVAMRLVKKGNERYAEVLKSRIEATFWDSNEPYTRSALPEGIVRLNKQGQSFPARLREILSNPVKSYGVDDTPIENPDDKLETQMMVLGAQSEIAQAQKAQALQEVAKEMVANLTKPRADFNNAILFQDATDIRSVIAKQGWVDMSTDVLQYTTLTEKLLEYGKARYQKQEAERELSISLTMNGGNNGNHS